MQVSRGDIHVQLYINYIQAYYNMATFGIDSCSAEIMWKTYMLSKGSFTSIQF